MIYNLLIKSNGLKTMEFLFNKNNIDSCLSDFYEIYSKNIVDVVKCLL